MRLQNVPSSGASPEVVMNENFEALEAGGTFGIDRENTTGLTLGLYGGVLYTDGTPSVIGDTTTVLAASQTNYVERTRTGTVSDNTTGFSADKIPIGTATTNGSGITAWQDYRDFGESQQRRRVSVAVTTADVTLTRAQAQVDEIKTTGTLTGNRAVIVPTVAWAWVVDNSTAGAFTLTVKTAAGAGVVVPQGTVTLVYCDGTDVKTLSGIAGNLTVGGTFFAQNLSASVPTTGWWSPSADTIRTPNSVTIDDNLTVSGTGPHAIGGATNVNSQLQMLGTFAATDNTTTNSILRVISVLTAAANASGAGIHISTTLNEAGSGTHPDFAALFIDAPTIGAGAAALTNASTVKITGAPTGATNNYALWNVGNTRLDNVLFLTGAVDHYVKENQSWGWSSDGTVNGTIRGYFGFDSSSNASIYTGAAVKQVQITHTASATRYITLTGSNGGDVGLGASAGGINISAPIVTLASATGRAGVNIPSGTAPSSPVSGDFWYDGTNLKFRDGVTTRTLTWT